MNELVCVLRRRRWSKGPVKCKWVESFSPSREQRETQRTGHQNGYQEAELSHSGCFMLWKTFSPAVSQNSICLWCKVRGHIEPNTLAYQLALCCWRAGILTLYNKVLFGNSGINLIQFTPPHVEGDWICIQMEDGVCLIWSRRPNCGSDINALGPFSALSARCLLQTEMVVGGHPLCACLCAK